MTNKIVAVQGNHPSTLNPATDTSVFLANEIQNKYKIFYYDPKNLSLINKKVLAKGFFIKFNYKNKKFYKIIKEQSLDLTKCKFILIRQDPPFNLEYISTTPSFLALILFNVVSQKASCSRTGFSLILRASDSLNIGL